jgi:Fe-S-cluster containining protein
MRLSEDQLDEFRNAVSETASRADVREAIENIYRALQDAIDIRRPVCTTSGRCCRFDEFGHRLFVTTMEMATFIGAREGEAPAEPGRAVPSGSAGASHSPSNSSRCPFQHDRLCSAHSIRPFGCRVFFCDATSTEWQHRQYEFFQRELKRLHERLEIPYFYVEWRQALQAVGVIGAPLSSSPDSL